MEKRDWKCLWLQTKKHPGYHLIKSPSNCPYPMLMAVGGIHFHPSLTCDINFYPYDFHGHLSWIFAALVKAFYMVVSVAWTGHSCLIFYVSNTPAIIELVGTNYENMTSLDSFFCSVNKFMVEVFCFTIFCVHGFTVFIIKYA